MITYILILISATILLCSLFIINYLNDQIKEYKKLLHSFNNQYQIPISLPMPTIEKMQIAYYTSLASRGLSLQAKSSALHLASSLLDWANHSQMPTKPPVIKHLETAMPKPHFSEMPIFNLSD
jgi:hypothetical protein